MAIEAGDGVTIEYVGRFEDGTVFDTSRYAVAVEHDLLSAKGDEPSDYPALSFTVGSGDVIEGLDEALAGLSEGAETTVTVPPEKGYGEVEADRVREYDPEAFSEMVGEDPSVGMHVQAKNDLHGDVIAVREDAVEVDFNHELAGKTLVFEIEVVEVW
jgi:peptidyl-prolyl cis-trans isomerase B (cyclophilin B)